MAVQPKKTSKRREPIRASTAGEAIEKMLEQKKISSKINYDVLRDLNSKGSSSPAHRTEDVSGIVPGRKKLTRRKKQPNKSNLGLAKPASLMGKRWELRKRVSFQQSKLFKWLLFYGIMGSFALKVHFCLLLPFYSSAAFIASFEILLLYLWQKTRSKGSHWPW